MPKAIPLFLILYISAGLACAQKAPDPTPNPPGAPAPQAPTPFPAPAEAGIPGRPELDMGFAIQKARGPEAARKYFAKAKGEGNVEADYQLYVMDNLAAMPEYNDLLVTARSAPPREQEGALNHLLDFTIHSANQGNAEAENRLWFFYSNTNPFTKTLPDLPEARKWLQKAAGQGDDQAEDALGQFYEHRPESKTDLGLPKNMALARHWYALAASKGNGDALRAILRFDTENAPMALTGLMVQTFSQATPTAQALHLDEPATLGGEPVSVIQLFPRQETKTFDPYAAVSGHLHWEGTQPFLDVDSLETIPDQGAHLVDYLLRGYHYSEDILVGFRDEAKGTGDLLEQVGKSWSVNASTRLTTIQLKKGMKLKEALTLLANDPRVMNLSLFQHDWWGFE